MKWRKWFSGIFLIGFYFSMANPLWAVTFDGVHYLIPPGLVNGYSAGKVPAELVLIQGKEVAGTMHPVVTIGNGAFSNCTTLEHVVIPETKQTGKIVVKNQRCEKPTNTALLGNY